MKQMTMTPHPFHIVGECQDCCDESEALRLGYPDPAPMLLGCETPGCVNTDEEDDELSPIVRWRADRRPLRDDGGCGMTGPSRGVRVDVPQTENEQRRSALAFRCCDEFASHPLSDGHVRSFSGISQCGVLFRGEAHGPVDGARVVGSGSAGPGTHGGYYSANGKSLTRATLETTISLMTTTTEFALMVEWDDASTEFVPATDRAHAERMATTLYSHRPSWTVTREVPEWSYATPNGLPHCPTCDMPLTVAGYCKQCGS